MGEPLRTTARFPGIALGDGHYESFYLKASHPTEPISIWLRYTVHKRPGERPRGSLWLTLFDARADGPWAVKQTTDDVGAGADHYIRVGDSRFEPGRVVGSAAADGRSASWRLELESSEAPFRHLPREWMYRAPLPRTKLLSPHPDARFSGRVEAGGRVVELDGWRGMVGHNWGVQHAERWIWMHGADFAGHDDAWFDAALGRVRVGRWTTPWIANGVLCLDGVRHRLGGIGATRRTEVDEAPDGCTFTLPGDGITVQGRIAAARRDVVGWIYADPDGSEHNTANCSVSDMTLTVSRPAQPPLTLDLAADAAYELGMRETDHGIPLQPFPDG
ncbi:MAG: hypothetical protein WD399_06035 [Thermoleophilaceae bacterium]